MATQTTTLPATQEGQAGTDRALRSGYRQLHARAIRDGEDLVSLEKSKLADLLAEANTLQEQVQRPREQAVDSEVFAHLTDRGVELAKKLAHGGKGHTAKDFLRRLKAQWVKSSQAQDDGAADPRAFQWEDMGLSVSHMFRPAPGVFCMVGPLDAKVKLRKAPVRHAKQQLAEVVRPDEINNMEETEKQETDRNLDEVWAVLIKEGSVPFLELVVNHASFAQTVENTFSVSFLVKDGKVSLTKSDKGIMVNKVSAVADDTEQAPDVERLQFVINMTMENWETWKRYCHPKDFRLKHREPRDHGAPAQASPASSDAEDEAGTSGSPAEAAAAPEPRSGGGSGSQQKRKGRSRPKAVEPSDDEADEAEEDEEPVPKRREKRKD